MKISKRILSLGLSLAIVICNTPNASALSKIDTIQGKDRYETAAKIAEKQNYTTAILVNSDKSLADGLSASGLSGAVDAPILLTSKDNLPQPTLERLNNVTKVYLIGGPGAISVGVENHIKDKGIEVERIGGNDRIQTSYNVAKEISTIKNIDKIVLTNAYKGEADAMSIAPVAVRDKAPIILTDGNNIPFEAKSIESYVIGSSSVMSDKLVNETNSTRLGGKDRFETNKKVIEKFYPNKKEFHVAKGWQLVDALTASPIAKDEPVVLVHDGTDKKILKGATKVTALGGISNNVIQECLNAINGTSGTNGLALNKVIPMKDLDGGNYEVTFEGVRLTDERNPYSDINPEKVFFLDYNYKNINCKEDVWVMDGIEFKVADGEGNMLSSYPISDNSRVQSECPAGMKSVASRAFAITSKSNSVTIIVYDKATDKVIGKINIDL